MHLIGVMQMIERILTNSSGKLVHSSNCLTGRFKIELNVLNSGSVPSRNTSA